MKAADAIKSYVRVRLPKAVTNITATDEDGNTVNIDFTWDEFSRSVLFTYESKGKLIKATGEF